MVDDIEVGEVVEDALKMSQGAFMRHGVQIERMYQPVSKITGERDKILQILNNLCRNAKYAVDESSETEKRIEIHIAAAPPDMVRIIVKDNGVGIPPENLTRIFARVSPLAPAAMALAYIRLLTPPRKCMVPSWLTAKV